MQKKEYKYYKASFVIGKKADGSPERVYVRGKTKRERDEKLTEAKRLHARGFMVGEMTVREWSERWMATFKSTASIDQRDAYRSRLNKDVLPTIGSMRMKDVRKSVLQELVNTYKDGKWGTVVKIRMTIKQLFRDAVEDGIIERNPAVRLEMPETTEEHRRPLTADERRILLKVSETHPRGLYYLTMMYCGVRRGEDLALTCADVDLTNKRLTINKALYLKGREPELSTTKAAKLRRRNKDDSSIRVVPIPDILISKLGAWCEGKAPEELLFPKSDGKHATATAAKWWWKTFSRALHIEAGTPLYRNALQYDKAKFDVNVTAHYLRHTYATDLYAAGVDEKARKTFLGHALPDVTDTYTAMSDVAFIRATKLINEYLNSEEWGKYGATAYIDIGEMVADEAL